LVTDASATHAGAPLQQRRRGQQWQPLGFFLVKLDSPQQKYSAFDRELLAVFLDIRHFRFMLEGRQFVVFTDHRPLLGALGRVSEPWSARQQRQLSYIAEFTADIRHIAGQSNIVADTLSRPAVAPADTSSLAAGLAAAALPQAVSPAGSAASPPVDLQELAAAQASCPDCQTGKSSPVLHVLDVAIDGGNVLVDVSSGVFRPLVPAIFSGLWIRIDLNPDPDPAF
jgi:RNase H-like domain found in reverse transcriptase